MFVCVLQYSGDLREDYCKALRHEAKLQSIENHESVHKTYVSTKHFYNLEHV